MVQIVTADARWVVSSVGLMDDWSVMNWVDYLVDVSDVMLVVWMDVLMDDVMVDNWVES